LTITPTPGNGLNQNPTPTVKPGSIALAGQYIDNMQVKLDWNTSLAAPDGYTVSWSTVRHTRNSAIYDSAHERTQKIKTSANQYTVTVGSRNVIYRFKVCLLNGNHCRTTSNPIDIQIPAADTQSSISPTPTAIVTPMALLGDINDDKAVDGHDYLIWQKHRHEHVKPYTLGDLNGDGVVDNIDQKILITEMMKYFKSKRR
jgi:hypothetical protein